MAHVPTVADKYRKGLGDTILVCQEYEELTAYYVNGIDYKPHYPAPAIPLTVEHFRVAAWYIEPAINVLNIFDNIHGEALVNWEHKHGEELVTVRRLGIDY